MFRNLLRNFRVNPVVNVRENNREIRSGVNTSVVEEFAETRTDRVVSTNIARS